MYISTLNDIHLLVDLLDGWICSPVKAALYILHSRGKTEWNL